MTSFFPTSYSDATDWANVAKELSDGLSEKQSETGGLGILYVSDDLADDYQSILTYLHQTTSVETWIGTIGLGVIGNDRAVFERSGAAAMVLDVTSDAFRLIEHSPIPDRWADELLQWAETIRPVSALVHADGQTPDLANLLESLTGRTGAFLIGGLTCSRGAQHQLAGSIGSGGVSGALFAPDIPITVGLSQGCTPLGPSHEITRGEGNVIAEIDGQPALEVFKEDIGEILARDLQRVAGYVHVAFPVSGADGNADYLVRNLMAIDPEHGWLGVATEVMPGDRVMFVRRDPQSAQTDLLRMVEDVKKRMAGHGKGAVYISCVARGPNMFGDEGKEAELISNALGDTPVIGFYAGGEISNARLYGYTGVLLAFG